MVQIARPIGSTAGPPASLAMSLRMLAIAILLQMAGGGLGRFTYAAVLPMMQRSLGLSYVALGALATANFLGYLAFSFFGGLLATRFGFRGIVGLTTLLAGLCVIAVGLAASFTLAVILHLIVGAAVSLMLTVASAVAVAWFGPRYRGLAVGLTSGGNGLGLLVLGGLVAFANTIAGPASWRIVWLASGTLILVVGVISLAFLRDRPADVGLAAFGEATVTARQPVERLQDLPWFANVLPFLPFFYGTLFTSTFTFFKPFLLDARGLSDAQVNGLWAIVGSLSAVSSILWGFISDRLGRLLTITLVLTSQAASVLAFIILPDGMLAIAAFAFGLVSAGFYPSVAATAALWYGPRRLPTVLGIISTAYGTGQLLAPVIGGALAQTTGTIRTALWYGIAGALFGAFGALALLIAVGDTGRRSSPHPKRR